MDPFQVTLDNCCQEPIHIPNRIQPNGFLLVVRLTDKCIIQVSKNTMEHLKVPFQEILGKPLGEVFYKVYTKLKECLKQKEPLLIYPVRVILNSKKYVCVPHSYQPNILILEFEGEYGRRYLSENVFLQQLSNGVISVQQLINRDELVSFTAKIVRRLTGYDRVMVYKFDQDYNGDVIAEEKKQDLYSFLYHKFPASDIPRQARELYLKNWVRVINNVDYVPVDLEPAINAVTNEFIDLSKAFLRSVSPIHIEYLKNMKVKATLTISIVVEGELWGLIACHHYAPKYLFYDQRMGIEFFGKVLSQKWYTIETEEVRDHKDRALNLGARIMSAIRFSNNLNEILISFKEELLNITESDGMLIVYDDSFLTLGKVPPHAFGAELSEWLLKVHDYKTFCTNELYRHFPLAEFETGSSSGILTIGFNVLSSCRIIWFRGEYMQSQDWGGNPNEKTLIMMDDESYRLSPRKSFKKWTEAIKNRSKDWGPHHIEVAKAFKSNFAEILAWRNSVYKQQKEQLEIQVNEKTQEVTALYEQLLEQYKKLEVIAFEQSHTVRAPLTTIMGIINLLETETEKEKIYELHQMLKQKANELDAVIKAIIRKSDK